MPYVKRPFTTQPAGAAPIAAKWRNGHVLTVSPPVGLLPFPGTITYGAGCHLVGSPRGISYRTPGTSEYITIAGQQIERLASASGDYTLAYDFTPSSLGTNGNLFECYNGAALVFRAFFRSASSGDITHYFSAVGAGGDREFRSGVPVITGPRQVWCVTMSGNRYRFYLNGVEVNSSTATYPNIAWGTSTKTLRIGASAILQLHQLSAWARSLSANEVVTYSANVNCIFERSLYIPESSVSAATYTLTSATYVPGSLTSTSVAPRIVRTKA